MYRRIRTAAFAVVIVVLLSGLAMAQRRDDDDDNDHKDRQHEIERDHDRDRDRDRDRDDHRWSDRDNRDGNWRNQGVYGNGGYGNNTANRAGYNQGYQDGSRVGQSDMAHGKPFNSYPRGVYRTSDHGYHSSYGAKGDYQQSYLSGYETGYRSSYRRSSGRY